MDGLLFIFIKVGCHVLGKVLGRCAKENISQLYMIYTHRHTHIISKYS